MCFFFLFLILNSLKKILKIVQKYQEYIYIYIYIYIFLVFSKKIQKQNQRLSNNKLHNVSKNVLSNQDAKFLSYIWKVLQGKIGTKLLFSTTCHLHIDGQIEVVNKT